MEQKLQTQDSCITIDDRAYSCKNSGLKISSGLIMEIMTKYCRSHVFCDTLYIKNSYLIQEFRLQCVSGHSVWVLINRAQLLQFS